MKIGDIYLFCCLCDVNVIRNEAELQEVLETHEDLKEDCCHGFSVYDSVEDVIKVHGPNETDEFVEEVIKKLNKQLSEAVGMKTIEDIKSVHVNWSESAHINDALGGDGGEIGKDIDKYALDSIIKEASAKVGIGYDKTYMHVKMKNGDVYEDKFNLTRKKDSLIKLIEEMF